jgi:hypothetical protein
VFRQVYSSLSACTTPTNNYQAKTLNISEPPLNTGVTVSVGDVMLRQGVYTEQDGIRLSEVVKIGLGSYTLMPGLYTKTGDSDGGSFYLPSPTAEGGKVNKSILSDPFQSVYIKKNDQKVCVVTVFNLRACSQKSVTITPAKVPSITANSFQQTLIYLGKYGNKINIGYREFSSDMARPAFNNDVEYDMQESSIIAYKGAKVEVKSATNQDIKFLVISNFNTVK